MNKKEIISRLKTLAWSSGILALTVFVDSIVAGLTGGISLPSVNIGGIEIDSAVLLGLILTQVSKYLHNMKYENSQVEA